MHILFEGRPEYHYEALALAVLGGNFKYDEPFGIAATEFYDTYLANASLKGKRALSIILVKIIFDCYKSNELELVTQALKLEDKIWSELNSENVSKFVDDAIGIAEKMKF